MLGIESAIISTLIKQKNYTQLDQAKIRFGMQIILSNVYKTIIIYGIALVLNCIVPTLIAHLTFYLLRKKCFGYHFSTTFTCILWSIIAFPFLSAFFVVFQIPQWLIWGISIFSVYIIFAYAPVETLKHRIVNEEHHNYLKKHARIRLFVVIIFIKILPIDFQIFVVQGLFIQGLAILIQIILGGKTHESNL
ncbi:accessory gene regulator ArgB-like protein [Rummeliibacillus pycnus]|uniref:accessory gene regulator ArgB-like protein n=1 Tax=Rummeliibacillus pycnus TaxID=101070 RepID=UPI0037C7AADA